MGASAVLQVVKSGGQPSQASNESAAAEGSSESGSSQGSGSGPSDSSSVVSISGFESLPAPASQGDQFLISGGVFARTSITIGAALGWGGAGNCGKYARNIRFAWSICVCDRQYSPDLFKQFDNVQHHG